MTTHPTTFLKVVWRLFNNYYWSPNQTIAVLESVDIIQKTEEEKKNPIYQEKRRGEKKSPFT